MSFLKRQNVAEGFTRGVFSESDMPLSLFCGEAGRAWLWAVAERQDSVEGGRLEGRCIGYNDV
jgi:hypothetical protein